jgi:sugar phosphate permease
MFPAQRTTSNTLWKPRYTVLALMWLVYGCFYLNRLNFAPVIPLIMEDLKLSHAQVGFVSALFFAFYAAAQLPAGYLSDILGPKKIITFGGFISALANFFFSAVSSMSYLIGAQSLNGLGQGGGWGPSVKLLNNWFPESERGRALGAFCTCVSIFTVLAYVLAGYLGDTFGWRAAFWTTPMILLAVVFVFWMVVDDHPGRPSEPNGANTGNRNRLIAIVSNKDLRMVCLGFSCLNYISYCNLVWVPAYLHESYSLSVITASLFAGMYPAAGIIARPLGGYLSDVTFGGMRRPLVLIGLFFILLSTALLASTKHLGWAVILIVCVGFFDQLIGTLFFALELDMLPSELAGTGAGFVDAGGHMGSMSAMFISGLLVDLFSSYKPMFFALSILACIAIVAVLCIRESKVLRR